MSKFEVGTPVYTIQVLSSDQFIVMRHRVMGSSKERVNLSGFMTWWPHHMVYMSHNEAVESMIKKLKGMLQ